MDLKEAILAEHSKRQTDRIVRWIGSDKVRFKELVKLFLEGEHEVPQRAAWPMSYCVLKHPELAKPWLKKMLLKTQEKDVHDSVKRNVLRLLQGLDIPVSLTGLAAQICFGFLGNAKESVAIRAFSMTVLCNIVKLEPGLKNELRVMIEDMTHLESPAIRSRGKRTLKELSR